MRNTATSIYSLPKADTQTHAHESGRRNGDFSRRTLCDTQPYERGTNRGVLSAPHNLFLFLFAVIALLTTGCSTRGTVAPADNPSEIVLTKELREYLAKNPQPSLLLIHPDVALQTVTNHSSTHRTRAHQSGSTSVTASRNFGTATGSGWSSSTTDGVTRSSGTAVTEKKISAEDEKRIMFYESLEKELLKAGFTLRDHSLARKMLSKDVVTDYSQIGKQLKADLFIEITALDFDVPFWQSRYTGEDGNVREFNAMLFNTPYN